MRPVLVFAVTATLTAALAAPAAAGGPSGDDAASVSAAKKCKKGYTRKKSGRGTRCVRKKAKATPAPGSGVSFDGKTSAGKYMRFVIAADGRLVNFSALAPRRCTLFSDGSVIQDTQEMRYSLGSTRGPGSNFKIGQDGSVSGTFATGTFVPGQTAQRLTLSARPSGGKLTGTFRIEQAFPTNACDSGTVKF